MNYQEYLETEHWQKTRKKALKRAGYKCQACGEKKPLQVHHNNYDNLWSEKNTDLLALCNKCYEKLLGDKKAPDIIPDNPVTKKTNVDLKELLKEAIEIRIWLNELKYNHDVRTDTRIWLHDFLNGKTDKDDKNIIVLKRVKATINTYYDNGKILPVSDITAIKTQLEKEDNSDLSQELHCSLVDYFRRKKPTLSSAIERGRLTTDSVNHNHKLLFKSADRFSYEMTIKENEKITKGLEEISGHSLKLGIEIIEKAK